MNGHAPFEKPVWQPHKQTVEPTSKTNLSPILKRGEKEAFAAFCEKEREGYLGQLEASFDEMVRLALAVLKGKQKLDLTDLFHNATATFLMTFLKKQKPRQPEQPKLLLKGDGTPYKSQPKIGRPSHRSRGE